MDYPAYEAENWGNVPPEESYSDSLDLKKK